MKKRFEILVLKLLAYLCFHEEGYIDYQSHTLSREANELIDEMEREVRGLK